MSMGMAPFDWHGPAFLALYGVLLAMTVAAGIAIPRWLRPEGRGARAQDPDQLAYLAGGSARLIDAVMARMLALGQVTIEGRAQVRIVSARLSGHGPEQALRELPNPAPWPSVQKAIARQAQSVEAKLTGAGLLIDRPTGMQLRIWQTAPYLLLIGFGLIKWQVGVMRDRPVGYLTALLALTAIAALIRFAVVDRRTRSGIAALTAARGGADRLRRAPTDTEMPLAVALFGTATLAGSEWEEYHRLRAAAGSADGGSGDGGGSDGGDAGGGCGGGGCGS